MASTSKIPARTTPAPRGNHAKTARRSQAAAAGLLTLLGSTAVLSGCHHGDTAGPASTPPPLAASSTREQVGDTSAAPSIQPPTEQGILCRAHGENGAWESSCPAHRDPRRTYDVRVLCVGHGHLDVRVVVGGVRVMGTTVPCGLQVRSTALIPGPGTATLHVEPSGDVRGWVLLVPDTAT